jgi:hypothetical protein
MARQAVGRAGGVPPQRLPTPILGPTIVLLSIGVSRYVMTDKSFTLLEVHLHDGLSFSATNTAPAIGGSGEDGTDSEAATEAGEETYSVGLRTGALVALVLLVALAVAAKYLRGDDDLGELADLDDFAEE